MLFLLVLSVVCGIISAKVAINVLDDLTPYLPSVPSDGSLSNEDAEAIALVFALFGICAAVACSTIAQVAGSTLWAFVGAVFGGALPVLVLEIVTWISVFVSIRRSTWRLVVRRVSTAIDAGYDAVKSALLRKREQPTRQQADSLFRQYLAIVREYGANSAEAADFVQAHPDADLGLVHDAFAPNPSPGVEAKGAGLTASQRAATGSPPRSPM